MFRENKKVDMKIWLKVFLFVLLAFTTFFPEKARSQYLENDPSVSQRIFYGGNLGLRFGDYTNVSINPHVGYRISNRFSAGIGGNYIYVRSRFFNYEFSLWGANVFASYTVFKHIDELIPFLTPNSSVLIYGEYNVMNVEDYFKNHHSHIDMKWMVSPMLGPAYQTQIGRRSYALISVLFNFNESRYSVYPNPVVRVSFQF